MIARFLSLVVIVLLGVFARRRYGLDATAMTRVTLEIFFPPFVLLSILDATFTPGDILHPALACGVVILGSLGIIVIAGRLAGRSLLAFALPIAFMNSGFLALPMADALGGPTWVARALVYDQMMNVVLFTAGLAVLGAAGAGRRGLREILLNPLLLTIVIGLAWKSSGIGVEPRLRAILDLIGRAAIPIALFTTGAALAELRLTNWRGVLLAVAARYLLGFALGLGYIKAVGLEGDLARVILLSSTMPSAVLAFLLPKRYGVAPDFAAGVVFLSTLLYPLVLPGILLVIRTCC
jgi:hypothetical protein